MDTILYPFLAIYNWLYGLTQNYLLSIAIFALIGYLLDTIILWKMNFQMSLIKMYKPETDAIVKKYGNGYKTNSNYIREVAKVHDKYHNRPSRISVILGTPYIITKAFCAIMIYLYFAQISTVNSILFGIDFNKILGIFAVDFSTYSIVFFTFIVLYFLAFLVAKAYGKSVLMHWATRIIKLAVMPLIYIFPRMLSLLLKYPKNKLMNALAKKKYKKYATEEDKYPVRLKTSNLILTNNLSINLDTLANRKRNNVLVLGGAGTGKTRSFVMPNLFEANANYIVHDVKGYLHSETAEFLKSAGYEIILYDVNNPDVNDIAKLNLDELVKKDFAIFVKTDFKSDKAAAFFEEITAKLFKMTINFENWKLPQRTHIILEDFDDIDKIPSLLSCLEIGQQRNMAFFIIAHGLRRIKDKYGAWQDIAINCDSTLFMGSNDKHTCGFIAHIIEQSMEQKVSLKESMSLMSAEEVENLDKDKCILVMRGVKPMLSEKYNLVRGA
jgi:type IV secretory pathway TraG/TraD family ATPase VirD4